MASGDPTNEGHAPGVDMFKGDILKKVSEYQFYVNVRDPAHFLTALQLKRRERLLGIPVIVTTTVVGTAIFATLQQDTGVAWRIATGMLSVLAAMLAALQTFFNYGGEAERHEAAAVGYARLWRRMDQFQLRHRTLATSRQECLADLDQLILELDELEKQAPRVSNEIYTRAKRTRLEERKARGSEYDLAPLPSRE